MRNSSIFFGGKKKRRLRYTIFEEKIMFYVIIQ